MLRPGIIASVGAGRAAPAWSVLADAGFTISSILGGLLGIMLIVYGVWTLRRMFGRGAVGRSGRRRR